MCKTFQLNRAQELLFILALQNSSHEQVETLANEHIQQRLPEFIQMTSTGMQNEIEIYIAFYLNSILNKIKN